MSSVEWKGDKCKGATHAKNKLMHDDKAQRLIHEHSNTHINKDLTPFNYSYYGLTYKEKCEKYDAAVAKASNGVRMSSGKNANVTLQGLCVYPPDALVDDPEKLKQWFMRVGDIAVGRWGSGVIDLDVHVDEIHDYTDSITKLKCRSKVHGHLQVVPVDKKGRLNCKKFSARWQIEDFNNVIEKMTREEFGCKFNTGKKRKGKYKSVEELKAESEQAAVEQGVNEILESARQKEEDAADLQRDTYRRKRKVETDEIRVKREKIHNESEADRLKKQRNELDTLRNTLNIKQQQLQEKEEDLERREKDIEKLEKAVKSKGEALDAAVRTITKMPDMDEELEIVLNRAVVEVETSPNVTFPFVAMRFLEHLRESHKNEAALICRKAGHTWQPEKKEAALPRSGRTAPDYAFTAAQQDDGLEL